MHVKYFLLIVLIILFIVGCVKKEPPKHDKIVFGVDVVTMASAPVFVAEAKGFWKQEGVDVEIRPFVSGRLALDALVGNAVDAATVADISVVLAAFQQQKVQIIGTFSTSEKHVNILVRKDKGISKPEDLRGKKIAVSLGTSAEFVIGSFLERHGINQSSVQIVNLNPPDMAAAITRQDVDAITAWQPHIYNAKKNLGENAVIFSSKGIYNHPFSIVVLNDSINNDKEAQKKLLIGLKRAEKFMKENKTESIEIVAKRIGIDAKVIGDLWDDYSFKVGIDPSFATTLEKEGEWAKRAGIVKQETKEPDYKSLIYEEYLTSIK